MSITAPQKKKAREKGKPSITLYPSKTDKLDSFFKIAEAEKGDYELMLVKDGKSRALLATVEELTHFSLYSKGGKSQASLMIDKRGPGTVGLTDYYGRAVWGAP